MNPLAFQPPRFLLLWAAGLLLAANIARGSETLQEVAISPAATQRYSLLVDDGPADVTRVWVLFFGYDGHTQPVQADGSILYVGRGLLTDGRRLFQRKHTAVVVVDSPSNLLHLSGADRRSEAYLAGSEKVLDDIHRRFPKARTYLVGASNGSISALELAARMQPRIAGVVLLAGVYHDVAAVEALKLTQPLLFVHHVSDQCVKPVYDHAFIERFHPVMVADIGIHYASQCGPYSPHQFHGQEAAVVDLIYRWADGEPVPAEIR